jgi:hypothetical protein
MIVLIPRIRDELESVHFHFLFNPAMAASLMATHGQLIVRVLFFLLIAFRQQFFTV